MMRLSKWLMMLLLACMILPSCHRDTEIEQLEPEISDAQVEAFTTTAIITFEVEFEGQFQSFVDYSMQQTMNDSIEVEAVKENGSYKAMLDGLSPNTKYYYRTVVKNGISTFTSKVHSFKTMALSAPEVTTSLVTEITGSSAKCGGDVTGDGGGTIRERGICWSTEPMPTIADSHVAASTAGTGSFECMMADLMPSTTYHVRAYVVNDVQTSYGEDVSFETEIIIIINLPSVNTVEVTDVTATSAQCLGTVTSDGGASLIEKGLCWGLQNNPTIDGNHVVADDTAIGDYLTLLTGLSASKTYHVRCYAKNEKGVAYGEDKSFTTLDGLPQVTTGAVTNITATSASCSGEVTDEGASPVTKRGVCWSTNHNPTMDGNHQNASTGGLGGFTINMTGLTPNATYYVRAFAKNSQGTTYGDEIRFEVLEGLPSVIVKEVSSVTSESARIKCEVTDQGGSPITERGVCWGTGSNPTIDNNKVPASTTGTGVYYCDINGLEPGKTYHVRAYVKNTQGLTYSGDSSFTTNAVSPTVTTDEVTNITQTTANGSGTVTDDGGAAIIERGVCWSTSHNPTTNNNHQAASNNGTGSFTVNMTGLTANKTYYYRAYARNSVGTSYGEEKHFETLPNDPVITPPTVVTGEVTNITQTTAAGSGVVASDGGAPVTERGVCWGTSANPSVSGNHIAATSSGTGSFTCAISGLTSGTTYYVRAYAINSQGISYGDNVHFNTSISVSSPSVTTATVTNITTTSAKGGGNVTSDGGSMILERGICWSTSANPTTGDHKIQASTNGTGGFTCDITGLTPGTTYHVRAYAINNQGTSYGEDKYFVTLADAPTVSTSEISNITQTTATGWGNVTSDGGASVIERGVCWSTSANPTTSDHKIQASTNGTGGFTCDITGLSPGTTYHVRAYAKNSVGTSYGNDKTFTTSQNDTSSPTVITNVVTNISQTTAVGNGNVTSDGGAAVTERGICWSTSSNPTISGNHVAASTGGTGAFSCEITGLEPETYYYVRAYAKNNVGTSYGESVTFITETSTPSAFEVITTPVTNISATSATGGGNVTGDGGVEVTERGVCWKTTHYPTVSDQHAAASAGGTGSYTVNMSNLQPGTLYYVRAYAINGRVIKYGQEVEFTTLAVLPEVVTNSAYNIQQNQVTCSGTVTSNGGSQVTERGICYSKSSNNPSLNNNHVSASTGGNGDFTCNLTGLEGGTTYWFRAYATNAIGTSYGEVLTFTTLTLPTVSTYDVVSITSTSALASGKVENDGGETVSECGICWSTSTNPTISGSHHTASMDGSGYFQYQLEGLTPNTTYHVRAYAKNSVGTSYGVDKTFTTTSPQAPTGAINGLFTINSAGDQVWFSQGNLQYSGSNNNPFWQFADSQWETLGTTTNQNSNNQDVDRDLFGWGTSGYHDSNDPYNVNYQPWSTSQTTVNADYNYYGYGPSTNMSSTDLTSDSRYYDWGVYNQISVNGIQTDQWRCLTKSEWVYVFNTRNPASGIRYAKATVNGVCGVILLPDNWSASYYTLNSTNNSSAAFTTNTITSNQWQTLEQHGAVFLPASGQRSGQTINNLNSIGFYWSSTHNTQKNAYTVKFDNSSLTPQNNACTRQIGFSVRLVKDVQ